MAKVSVLLPCYKPGIEHFKQALNSLINQTYSDWQATILHQPSELDIKSQITEQLQDERIEFVQSDVLRNIGENWNAVYTYATGEYVQFLFHDDIWYPKYLEESVKVLDAHADVGFTAAYHDYKYEDEIENKNMYEGIQTLRQTIAGKKHSGQEFLNMWLKRGLHPNIIGEPPFVMMRKEHMDTVGIFNENLPQFLDSEYWAKLLEITDFYFIGESLGAFRVHNEAASARNQRAGKGLTDRLKTIELLSKEGNTQTKHAAKACLKQVLPRMIRKYLDRKRAGKAVPGIGGGGMREFMLRNPLLTLGSLIKAYTHKATYQQENAAFEQGEVR